MDPALDSAVQQWLAYDKNPATLAEVRGLLEAHKYDVLRDRFLPRISFGTAGLRAVMGAGYACMNDLTVIQASQGLCAYLETQYNNTAQFSVVVGFDGRHHSRRFALRTATAFLQRGASVFLFRDITPTPFVAFAVTRLGCAAGVMVTASHNPKDDNGYKVYGANGAQIIAPLDRLISDSILAHLQPFEHAWDESIVSSSDRCSDPYDRISSLYFSELLANKWGSLSAGVKFAYTAMHGVGYVFAKQAFAAFGLQPFVPVKEQIEPDPDFPTVKYPNPEEGAGALTLAMRTAEEHGCTVILANDPDADRLAVAVQHAGAWRILSGNELGSLLAWWCWTSFRARNPAAAAESVYMLGSAVSTKMVASIAQAEGFQYEETLTGFKWMGNRARALQAAGATVLFSFEEAIGFCVGSNVVDKDGVCAAAVVAELALACAAQGLDLVDRLNAIYQQYGFHANINSYLICRSPPTIDKIFARIRADGYPKSIAGEAVVAVRDVTTGYDSSRADQKCVFPIQSGHMITFTLANHATITLRTSGTEPKIKYYTDMKVPAATEAERQAGLAALASFVEAATEELLQPALHGLERRA